MISCGGRARRNCAIVVRPEGVAGEGMALLPGSCSFAVVGGAAMPASPMGANMVVRL